MKKSVLLILFTLLNFYCLAQTFTTPEVFSFKKEVFTPISYYTGQANVSISLMDIPTTGIKIPVTLSYIGGEGLRAINPYSNVGMGWRISAGGAITRTKNEVCDEVISPGSNIPSGFFSLAPNSVTNDYVRNNVSSYVNTDGSGSQYFAPTTEYSPDVFSFSFLGYTGFFVRGYDGEFKIQSQDIAFVEKINNVSWPGIGNTVAFKLTANDGTRFTFGNATGSMELSGGNGAGIPYQAEAWYLTRIELNNGDIINFNYKENSSTFVRFIVSSETNNGSAVCPVVLDNITFKGGKVLFTSSTVTQQLSGQTSFPRMINKVELMDAANQIISTADFAYSSETAQRYYLLDSVTINSKRYSFGYYNRSNLPASGVALGMDYWGFYNGQNEVISVGSGNVSSNWDFYLNPTTTLASRMPSLEHAKRGILTSITYPSGGVESYEYEANTYSYKGLQTLGGTYYNYSDEPKIAGGLRIAKIVLGDMVKKYKYVNSFNPDNPDYDPQTESFIGFSSSGILYRLPGVPYFGRSALNALSIDGEPPIVYSKVIEFLSDKSYTEYAMRSPLDKPDEDNNQLPNHFSVWASQPAIFNNFPKMGFVGSLGKSSSRSLERGQVSSIKVYDSVNALKKSIVYSYATDPNRYSQYVSAVKIVSTADPAMANFALELQLAYNLSGLYFSVIHSYNIYTFPVYLDKEVETSYDGGTTQERTTQYQYNAQKLKSAITSSNSYGDVMKTTIKYPADVNTGNYATMVTKKMLNYPVEQVQLVNNNIVGGELITYKANSNTYVPDKKYSLELIPPVQESAFNYFNGTSPDSHYSASPKIIYNSYDSYNNLLELENEKGQKTSYKWGYNFQYPIAEVKNSGVNEFYSQNFEEILDFDGSIVRDATRAHTGKFSAKIANTGSGEMVSHGINNLDPFSQSTAKKFTYSGWVYSDGPPVELFLFMKRAGETGYYTYLSNTLTTQTGKWVYLKQEFLVPADVINLFLRLDNNGIGNVWFDDLRIQPSDASMSTYTYEPLVGMTSAIDDSGQTIIYEYDSFQRLKAIKNNKGEIIKSYDYHFKP